MFYALLVGSSKIFSRKNVATDGANSENGQYSISACGV